MRLSRHMQGFIQPRLTSALSGKLTPPPARLSKNQKIWPNDGRKPGWRQGGKNPTSKSGASCQEKNFLHFWGPLFNKALGFKNQAYLTKLQNSCNIITFEKYEKKDAS